MKILAIIALAAMAATIPAYAEIPEEVMVGSVLPLTGGYSSVGVQADAATTLAVEDFNAYLMEMGADWQFVLVREDSQSNPVAALERISSLHSKGIDIVFGPAGSARVQNVLGYADSNNMIVLSCCSTAPTLAIPGDSVYRIVADDNNQGKALGKLLQHNGIEVVVPLWIGDTYGDGLIDVARTDFKSRGGMADDGVRYNPDTAEFSVTVANLADTVQGYVDDHGADKVGIMVVAFDEIVSILQTAENYPVLKQVKWFGSETVADSTALREDRIAISFANSADFMALQVDVDRGDKAKRVQEGLMDRFGDSPNVFAYTAYDAVWLVGLSILEADSSDVTDIKAVITDVAAGYTTGAIRSTILNENGDLASGNYAIRVVENGNWETDGIYYSGTDTIPSPITEDVYVGSLLPLTGSYSSVGVQINTATALAVDDFNEYLADKNAGWEIVLFQENTQSNPVIALEKAATLHSRGADILFGPAGSGRVQNVKGYVDSNNMILVSCCSTAPSLAIADDRVFRVVPDDSNQGQAFGTLFEHSGVEAVVPLWIGDPYGDGLVDAAVNDFTARGGMADDGVRYNPDTVEFSASVANLADTVQGYVDDHGADKVGIMVVAFDEIVSILQTAENYPVLKQVKWFGSETIAQSTAISRDRIAGEFADEAEFVAIQAPLGTGPKAQYVTDTLSVAFGGTPNVFAYNGYDAVWLVGLTIERGGSTDPADIAALLPVLARSYTNSALESTALNENGDLELANYGVWHPDGDQWDMRELINIAENTVTSID